MIGDGMIVLVVLLLGGLAVAYARRVSTGQARGRYAHSFDVPPPVPAEGPVSMHLVELPAPGTGKQAAALALPGVDPMFVQRALDEAARVNAATYAAMTGTGRHRRPDGELPPGAVSATSIFRAVKADEAARPAFPSPTRDQLRRLP